MAKTPTNELQQLAESPAAQVEVRINTLRPVLELIPEDTDNVELRKLRDKLAYPPTLTITLSPSLIAAALAVAGLIAEAGKRSSEAAEQPAEQSTPSGEPVEPVPATSAVEQAVQLGEQASDATSEPGLADPASDELDTTIAAPASEEPTVDVEPVAPVAPVGPIAEVEPSEPVVVDEPAVEAEPTVDVELVTEPEPVVDPIVVEEPAVEPEPIAEPEPVVEPTPAPPRKRPRL